nr:MAG TPA: hypothetical protein [Caudoviricetes sp.]
MNNLNLTIELCAEDRARLDAILTALQVVGTPFSPPAPTQPVEMAPETHDAPAPVTGGPETEQPAQDTQDGAETQHATHGMVQDLVITLASQGHKAEAREIVQRFAPRVSAIPDADLDAVYVALDAVRLSHEGEN